VIGKGNIGRRFTARVARIPVAGPGGRRPPEPVMGGAAFISASLQRVTSGHQGGDQGGRVIQRMNDRFAWRKPGAAAGYLAPRSRSALLPLMLIVLLFAIMVIPEGFDYLGVNPMPPEGDPVSRTIWLVLLCGGVFLVYRDRAHARTLLRATNKPFLVFMALASLSLLWSIEPAITFRRLFRLYVIAGVCIAFVVVGWEPRHFQKHLRRLLSLILGASAVFCYVSPELAIHHSESALELMNAWHGITTGKNVLGSLAGCGFIVWVHAFLTRESNRLVAVANMALAGLCLVMSRSSASLVATAFATILSLLLLWSPGAMRRYLPYIVVVFAAGVLLYAMAVLNVIPGLDAILKPISMITGKDQTFTGRTNIWYLLRLHIAQRPLLGTGFGAYWIGPVPSSPSFEMIERLFFYPTEGHNGYLDVINDLGYVGEACLIAYFVVYLRQAIGLLRLNRGSGALYLSIIFRAFLADMSETHWFSVLSIDFVILTLATFSLSRELLYAQQTRTRVVAPPQPRRRGSQLVQPAGPLPAPSSR
jgi:exopolysaccharide production protein ExoQ